MRVGRHRETNLTHKCGTAAWFDGIAAETLRTPHEIVASALPYKEAVRCLSEFGIYFLLYEGNVEYIGQSVNVSRRVWQHRRDGEIWFQMVGALMAPRTMSYEEKKFWIGGAEGYYVHLLNPIANERPTCQYIRNPIALLGVLRARASA